VRFWTAAETLRGLDDAFAADKRPAVLFPVNRLPITRLSRRSLGEAGLPSHQTSNIKHRRVCGLPSSFNFLNFSRAFDAFLWKNLRTNF
jgi:hypothetical protein